MKKQLIITLIAVLLIVVGFSGCFEEDNDKKENEKPLIEYTLIGSWETYPYYYENGVRIDDTPSTAIIYENGTMASISVVDGSTIWNPYSMVKFKRYAVQTILKVGEEESIVITGQLNYGAAFGGEDIIRVIKDA